MTPPRPQQPQPQPIKGGHKIVLGSSAALFALTTLLLALGLPAIPATVNSDLFSGTSENTLERNQLLLLPVIIALASGYSAFTLIKANWPLSRFPVATTWGWNQKYRVRRALAGFGLITLNLIYLDVVLGLTQTSSIFPLLGTTPNTRWLLLAFIVALALIAGLSHFVILNREIDHHSEED